jgi:hypothetical protein
MILAEKAVKKVCSKETNEGNISSGENSLNNNQTIPVPILGNLINDVNEIFLKFQPHLQEFQSLLVNDFSEPVIDISDNRRQRFCNNINDMLHLIGHLFHNLSDLHVNLLDTPPRNICCIAPQTAMISAITDVETATAAPPNSTNNAFMESTSRLNSTTPNNF